MMILYANRRSPLTPWIHSVCGSCFLKARITHSFLEMHLCRRNAAIGLEEGGLRCRHGKP
jgi:hypothetical protein